LLQHRDNLFASPAVEEPGFPSARITYGVLEHSLPLLRRFFAEHPVERRVWRDRLDLDVEDTSSVVALLLREAIRRNTTGPVLFSSSRTDRVRAAAAAVSEARRLSSPEESQAIRELALAVRGAYRGLDRAS